MEENDDEEEKHSEAEVLNIFLSSGCCCCIRFSFFKGELSRGVFADPIKLTGEPSVGQCRGMSSLLAFLILQNVVDKEVSVDWTSENCPLSTLTDFCIKWVEFKENARVFPRDKEK